jgi:molecular chaperone GrpE
MAANDSPDDDMHPEEEAASGAGGGQIAALKAEAAALKDQVLRYAADMENTRRRAEREANDARAYAIQKFARDLLGVADNLARALAAEPSETVDPVVKNFMVGVELTEKELQAAFERNGLKRIHPAKGDKFDPHQHQAMMEQADADVPPGAVLQVMQTGYELLGRLIRPAMVVVAAKGAGAGPKSNGDGGANPYGGGDGQPPEGGSVDTRA